MTTITAKEAAQLLGVKITTVYAYASRGWLQSLRDPTDPRKRLYVRAEVEHLRRRGDAHRGDEARASGALHWGSPVLETHISAISLAGPKYRGVLARTLVRQSHTFEEVSELLWTGSLERRAVWEAGTPLETPVLPDLDRIRVAILGLGVQDPERFSPARAIACGRRALMTAAAVVSGLPNQGPIAHALLRGWGADLEEESAMNAALVMLADHELNASTFAARVAASTNADLYACLTAALATFTGSRHGGSTARAEALVRDAVATGDAYQTLADWSQRPGPTPGFGHPLYSHGDPRVDVIIEALTSPPPVLDALRAAADRMGLGHPNVDLGLATFSVSLRLPPGSAAVIFAIGRMAGWIAHALEQREHPGLLRPRARYVDSPSC